jgi:hypothetical protein
MKQFEVEVEMKVKVTCGDKARIYKTEAWTYAMEGESVHEIEEGAKEVGFCSPPACIIHLAMKDFK